MNLKLYFFFLLINAFITQNYAQTFVGKIGFNDVDTFDNKELVLNGAGAKDKDYVIALYLNFEVDGPEDGIMVAEKDADMGFTIKMTSSKSKEELKNLIRIGLERATDGNSYVIEEKIREFIDLLPSEMLKHGIFRVSYEKGGVMKLYQNKRIVGTLEDSFEFKKAFFKIWLGTNPVNVELKNELLGTSDINPVLGSWKTFDKETGVALSIVRLYMIDKKLNGTIERMLRESERDAVCYKCTGEDKNQKVEGLVILKDLKLKDDYKYVNGLYTNIVSGKVADCQIWMDEDNQDVLKVRYKGGGGVHEWKRIETDEPTNREEYRTVKRF
ncbi:chalcone isomerase family protein [Aquimarina sp. ERC-38]|uniref:chalcone isomerase family protein n=1 Tax=Aquimarina sp. ERC-38 TaxID=2949996 RepID=UPI0022460750|nr:chalcone isomerase family protein [Aquimarina sp. ERC-38]UZO82490.1 chalcone isomerase family protein [Aquimarina sp. ERC-38]